MHHQDRALRQTSRQPHANGWLRLCAYHKTIQVFNKLGHCERCRGFGYNRSARPRAHHPCHSQPKTLHSNKLEDLGRGVEVRQALSDAGHRVAAAPFGGPHVDEQHVILLHRDDALQAVLQLDPFARAQRSPEHRELHVITETAHRAIDLPPPLRIADVVAD